MGLCCPDFRGVTAVNHKQKFREGQYACKRDFAINHQSKVFDKMAGCEILMLTAILHSLNHCL